MEKILSNSVESNNKEEKVLAPAPLQIHKPYKQAHNLADLSMGRIRRWGVPFRRPFSL